MLNIDNLRKTYPQTSAAAPVNGPALGGVSLHVKEGEFFTLLGPSGCGKTTLLQCIAGLEQPDSGAIRMGTDTVFDGAQGVFVPANRRRLGMVFQSYAIWPHMTVYENVAFPLRQLKPRPTAGEIDAKVMRALQRVHLTEFARRPAPYLSGGQQQRVALARALVSEPRLILLDEPLSNLDAKLRDEMRVELRQLVKALGITTIYVTHDQVEALSMSDRIALLNKGQIVQQGTPNELYMEPNSEFTAQFVGRSNVIAGKANVVDPVGDQGVETAFGHVCCDLPAGVRHGDPVRVMIRPHAIEVGATGAASNTFTAPVAQASFVGEFVDVNVALGGCDLRVFASPYDFAGRESLTFRLPPERCVVLRA